MRHTIESLPFGGISQKNLTSSSGASTASSTSDSWYNSASVMNLDEFLEQVAYHENLSARSRQDPVVHVDFSATDIALATSPNSSSQFDPSNVRFNEDELKPQPIVTKSRKTFVPETMKDGRYWARRAKNNVAAKPRKRKRCAKGNNRTTFARKLGTTSTVRTQ